MSTNTTENRPCPECKGEGSFRQRLSKSSFEIRTTVCGYCSGSGNDPTDPWGYDVDIQIRTGMVATEVQSFHKQGSEARVRKWAAYKKGYVSVVSMKPYTRTQWIQAYGDGRIRM